MITASMITKCRECEAQVSTEAPSCPHCGVHRPSSVLSEIAPRPQAPTSSATRAAQPVVGNQQLGTQVVVVVSPKIVGISIILTILFGPLGMFYSTVPGAIVMIVISVIVAILTVGFGLILTWPVCVI